MTERLRLSLLLSSLFFLNGGAIQCGETRSAFDDGVQKVLTVSFIFFFLLPGFSQSSLLCLSLAGSELVDLGYRRHTHISQ